MEFFKNSHIEFMKIKYVAIAISLIVIATSLGYVIINGVNLGIDFSGGHVIHLKFKDMPPVDEMRARLSEAGYPNAILQVLTDTPLPGEEAKENEITIRIQREDVTGKNSEAETTEKEQETVNKVVEALIDAKDQQLRDSGKLDLNLIGKAQIVDLLVEQDPLGYLEVEVPSMTAHDYAVREYSVLASELIDDYRDRVEESDKERGVIVDIDRAIASMNPPHHAEELASVFKEYFFVGNFAKVGTDMVSAAVGSELEEAALWSIVFSIAGILAYIWFRFNNRFSVAAIIALVHDVLITVGVFTIVGREFNLPIVAAILTIVGYSLNDTIVIFVRIREQLATKRREAKENYEALLNDSINQTLSRTILTSTTTLIVVLFLFFMGGSVINDFAFTLMIGILVGTYSSIFVASPVLVIWYKITGTIGAESRVKVKSTAPKR